AADAWPVSTPVLLTKARTLSCSTSCWVRDWFRDGSPPSSATTRREIGWQLTPPRVLTSLTQAWTALTWGFSWAPRTPVWVPTEPRTTGVLRVGHPAIMGGGSFAPGVAGVASEPAPDAGAEEAGWEARGEAVAAG